MTFSVTMPALGESVTEGTVTRWLKAEGDSVAIDEPLLEVSTDKVDTEIPSPVAGVLQKIVVAVDQTVAVGAELAIIADSGSAALLPRPHRSHKKLKHLSRLQLRRQYKLRQLHQFHQFHQWPPHQFHQPEAEPSSRCQHLANR